MPRFRSERDVYEANCGAIRQFCQKYGTGIEPEECFSIASEAFIHAIRTYKRERYRFKDYAQMLMYKYIQAEHMAINRRKKVESRLSLDQPVSKENQTPIGRLFFAASGDFVNWIVFKDFLSSLEGDLRKTAFLLRERFTPAEIKLQLRISQLELDWYMNEIQYAWEMYDAAAAG